MSKIFWDACAKSSVVTVLPSLSDTKWSLTGVDPGKLVAEFLDRKSHAVTEFKGGKMFGLAAIHHSF